jgi:hypothetical protein
MTCCCLSNGITGFGLSEVLCMNEVMTVGNDQAAPERPWLEVLGSRQFSAWLADHNVSLAFTTYQLGKLFLVGRQVGDRFSVFERTFSRCKGLWSDGQTIWQSSRAAG